MNFIKGSATQSRLFKLLCEDIGNLHVTSLLCTEMRWLSQGKIFKILFTLRNKAQVYFGDHLLQLASKFHDCNWL